MPTLYSSNCVDNGFHALERLNSNVVRTNKKKAMQLLGLTWQVEAA